MERTGLAGPANSQPAALHGTIEALRRAYVDRALYLGDADQVAAPLELLLSEAHVDGWREAMLADRATPSVYLPPGGLNHAGVAAQILPMCQLLTVKAKQSVSPPPSTIGLGLLRGGQYRHLTQRPNG